MMRHNNKISDMYVKASSVSNINTEWIPINKSEEENYATYSSESDEENKSW